MTLTFNTYTKYKGTRPEDKKVLYGTKLCVIHNQLFDLTVNYEGSQWPQVLYLNLCHVLIHTCIHTKYESSVIKIDYLTLWSKWDKYLRRTSVRFIFIKRFNGFRDEYLKSFSHRVFCIALSCLEWHPSWTFKAHNWNEPSNNHSCSFGSTKFSVSEKKL